MSKEDERNALARRLEDGWQRINEAERSGKSVADWEEFWLTLLRDYERLCDELEHAATVPTKQERFA